MAFECTFQGRALGRDTEFHNLFPDYYSYAHNRIKVWMLAGTGKTGRNSWPIPVPVKSGWIAVFIICPRDC
jgi:hypothetical protein